MIECSRSRGIGVAAMSGTQTKQKREKKTNDEREMQFGQIEVTDDRKAAVLRPVYTFAAFAGLTTALQAAELGCVPAWQWMVEHSEDAETEVFGRKLFDGRPPVGAGQSQER